MADETALTHHAPRITEMTFANALTEGPRLFKGASEIGAVWSTLIRHGMDPSFALGQFWAESLFGTAGWNLWSDPPMHSWGNILHPNSRLTGQSGVGEFVASNGFHYTTYDTWTRSVEDYCLLHEQYTQHTPDPQYGDTSRIYGATARWIAKTPGSELHLRYLDVVLGRIARYDARLNWEGEMAIFSPGLKYTSNARYEIRSGDRWYIKPGGTVSYVFRADASVPYFGQVLGTSWFQVRIGTGRLATDGKSRPVLAYLPKFDPSRLTVT